MKTWRFRLSAWWGWVLADLLYLWYCLPSQKRGRRMLPDEVVVIERERQDGYNEVLVAGIVSTREIFLDLFADVAEIISKEAYEQRFPDRGSVPSRGVVTSFITDRQVAQRHLEARCAKAEMRAAISKAGGE